MNHMQVILFLPFIFESHYIVLGIDNVFTRHKEFTDEVIQKKNTILLYYTRKACFSHGTERLSSGFPSKEKRFYVSFLGGNIEKVKI